MGTALEDGSQIRIEGGLATVEMQVAADRSFAISVNLRLDGLTQLLVTEVFADGSLSPAVGVDIIQDGTPPSLFIDFPADGAELNAANVDVAGRVADLLSGFQGLEVDVNGTSAEVNIGIGTNGTFLARNVSIDPDAPTLIQVSAMDQLGNMVTRDITVSRLVVGAGQARIDVESGNGQSAAVGTELPQVISVLVRRGDGSPYAGKVVNFEVDRSDGLLGDGSPLGSLSYQVIADAAGRARATWTLGSDAGCGNNRVSVTSKDVVGTVFFCASATPGPAAQINVGSGSMQSAEVGGPALQRLRVWVSDACNGVAGVPVTFDVSQGGGRVNGAQSVVVTTGATGHAEVDFVLGMSTGNHVVQANFLGNAGGPASFALLGVARDLSQATSFSGVVLNNSVQPIGGAMCRLDVGSAAPLTTVTDSAGVFEFADTMGSGLAHLSIDGSTATSVGGQPVALGSFPGLAYDVALVPNVANRRPGPILLPTMEPANARAYDGSQDVQLTVQGIEGLSMTVKAGSVTLADGSVPSASNPVSLSLNLVHPDDVPMPMPDGNSPPFAWTLQPSGAHFDPPVEIVYPNMSALPPGSIAYFLNFNHDTARFEIIGSGHVTDDGAQILSDPGVGISRAGWGCNCPPYAVTENVVNCNVRVTGETFTCPGLEATYTATVRGSGTLTWKVTGGAASPSSMSMAVSDGAVVNFTTTFGTPGLAGTAGMGNSGITVEASLACNSGGLTDTHGIGVNVVDIQFKASPKQNYGFDGVPGSDETYLSANMWATTSVTVVTNPPGLPLFAVSSDNQIAEVLDGQTSMSPARLTGTSTDVFVVGANFSQAHGSAKLQVVLGDEFGPTCAELNIEVYRQLLVPQVSFFRVRDSMSPGTTPALNPSLDGILDVMNEIYAQAVIEVGAVLGDSDVDLRYDLNNNGAVDIYTSGADPELSVITGGGISGPNNLAYVETIRRNWRLAAPAAAGQNMVQLATVAGLGLQVIRFGPQATGGELVTVTAIDPATNTITLAANLANPHGMTETVFTELAGISTNPQLVTDAGGELIITVVHETLHRMAFGGLADLAESDNVMYFATGASGAGLLRFRDQTVVNTGTGVPTGAKENQWNKVAR